MNMLITGSEGSIRVETEPGVDLARVDDIGNTVEVFGQNYGLSGYSSQFHAGYRGLSAWTQGRCMDVGQGPYFSEENTEVGSIPDFFGRISPGIREDIFFRYRDILEEIDSTKNDPDLSSEEKSRRIEEYGSELENLKRNMKIYNELGLGGIERKLSKKRDEADEEVISSFLGSFKAPLEENIAAESVEEYRETRDYRNRVYEKFVDYVLSDEELYPRVEALNRRFGLNLDDIADANNLFYQNILTDSDPENILEFVLKDVYEEKGVSEPGRVAHGVSEGEEYRDYEDPGELGVDAPHEDGDGSNLKKKIFAIGAAGLMAGVGASLASPLAGDGDVGTNGPVGYNSVEGDFAEEAFGVVENVSEVSQIPDDGYLVFGAGDCYGIDVEGRCEDDPIYGHIKGNLSIGNTDGLNPLPHFLWVKDLETGEIKNKGELPEWVDLPNFNGYGYINNWAVPHGPYGAKFALVGYSPGENSNLSDLEMEENLGKILGIDGLNQTLEDGCLVFGAGDIFRIYEGKYPDGDFDLIEFNRGPLKGNLTIINQGGMVPWPYGLWSMDLESGEIKNKKELPRKYYLPNFGGFGYMNYYWEPHGPVGTKFRLVGYSPGENSDFPRP